MPNDQLFPIEVSQYDAWVIRESLHNCIAHQDYRLCGRVNVTDTKEDYIRKRAFDKQHYKKMVEDYLRRFHVATRADLDKLLVKKLSDVLNNEQKRNFITNLLQEMRRGEIIRPVKGKRGRGAKWELCNKIKIGRD